MTKIQVNEKNPRRSFLEKLAAGTAAMGLATIVSPFNLNGSTPQPVGDVSEADAWFAKVKGKHKIVFDATRPNDMLPFAWPKTFRRQLIIICRSWN